MSPELTSLIVGAALTGAGWLGRELWASWQEARSGKKDEAQRIAAERDQWKQKAAENKALAETYYNNKQRVYDSVWEHRRVARAHGIPDDALPEVPPNHH